MTPYDKLPIKHGEDGNEYASHYHRYCHIGCPGLQYEDNCAAPWECASKGACRIAYERVYRENGNLT